MRGENKDKVGGRVIESGRGEKQSKKREKKR